MKKGKRKTSTEVDALRDQIAKHCANEANVNNTTDWLRLFAQIRSALAKVSAREIRQRADQLKLTAPTTSDQL